ncbi:hypothetical protein [Streptomyces sp. CA-253872]|uniref:hypothetical protein n=1 Tax=Streptomyces sp. CA-253872 TaxID=3240067 RepID=UPI003D8B2B98
MNTTDTTTHMQVARRARQRPGTWLLAGTERTAEAADELAEAVLTGAITAYLPVGAFEAYTIGLGSGPVLWVRYTGGKKLPQIPARMAVRIPAGEEKRPDSVGVLTVSVLPYCPVCGGPRGWDNVQPARVLFRQVAVWVDRWPNRCGHEDEYADLLREARCTPPYVPEDAEPGPQGADPQRAGAYRGAVELLLDLVRQRRTPPTRAGFLAVLRRHGHDEAARLLEIQTQVKPMGAARAAHFLTVKGAECASLPAPRPEVSA